MTESSDMRFPAVREGTIGVDTVQTVDARDLHAFLEVGRDFTTWIKARIGEYGFQAQVDYVTEASPDRGNQTGRGGDRRSVAFHLTIDMAKELAMVENSERGRSVRRYFLDCERRAKAGSVHFLVPKSLPEALRLAADQAERIETQKAQIAALAPKADFHDKVTEAVNCQTIEEVAKVLGSGQNRMFAWLRDQKILKPGNIPYQRFIDEGHFRIVERQYNDRRGESHTYTRTLVTGKGLAYIQKRFGEERAA